MTDKPQPRAVSGRRAVVTVVAAIGLLLIACCSERGPARAQSAVSCGGHLSRMAWKRHDRQRSRFRRCPGLRRGWRWQKPGIGRGGGPYGSSDCIARPVHRPRLLRLGRQCRGPRRYQSRNLPLADPRREGDLHLLRRFRPCRRLGRRGDRARAGRPDRTVAGDLLGARFDPDPGDRRRRAALRHADRHRSGAARRHLDRRRPGPSPSTPSRSRTRSPPASRSCSSSPRLLFCTSGPAGRRSTSSSRSLPDYVGRVNFIHVEPYRAAGEGRSDAARA